MYTSSKASTNARDSGEDAVAHGRYRPSAWFYRFFAGRLLVLIAHSPFFFFTDRLFFMPSAHDSLLFCIAEGTCDGG